MPDIDGSGEPRMTRAEWMHQQRIEECAAHGHAPNHHIRTLGDMIGYWTCDCKQYQWTASKTRG